MGIYQIFVYLQLLDLLTTLVGFSVGRRRGQPVHPHADACRAGRGVIVSKVLALGIGALCVYLHKAHVIRWISYWYGGLVVWNLMVMLAAPAHDGPQRPSTARINQDEVKAKPPPVQHRPGSSARASPQTRMVQLKGNRSGNAFSEVLPHGVPAFKGRTTIRPSSSRINCKSGRSCSFTT